MRIRWTITDRFVFPNLNNIYLRLHYVKQPHVQSRHLENYESRSEFFRYRAKKNKQARGISYHYTSRPIIFCSAGILHGESAAVSEARFGIVCASSNRHSLKTYSASFEKRALEHFAYVDVLVRGEGLERRFVRWWRFLYGIASDRHDSSNIQPERIPGAPWVTSRRWNLKGLFVWWGNGSDGVRLGVWTASQIEETEGKNRRRYESKPLRDDVLDVHLSDDQRMLQKAL